MFGMVMWDKGPYFMPNLSYRVITTILFTGVIKWPDMTSER